MQNDLTNTKFLDELAKIPDEVLAKISFSVPWQYSSDGTGTGKDADGFDTNSTNVDKKFNELKRDDLQKQCFTKFHTNPQINLPSVIWSVG